MAENDDFGIKDGGSNGGFLLEEDPEKVNEELLKFIGERRGRRTKLFPRRSRERIRCRSGDSDSKSTSNCRDLNI